MNNIIKKVSAFAMAFTLLGTGTAINNFAFPFSSTILSAEAANSAQNEKIIYEYLTNDLGLSTAATCGALANIYSESGFDPNITNSSSGAYGICQWLGKRKEYLINENKSNYSDIMVQLYYMKSELFMKPRKEITDYRLVGDKLKQNKLENENGAYQAGYDWCYYYEVPSTNKPSLESISNKRGNLAKKYFEKYSVTKIFNDVESDNWYVPAIQFAYDNGIMSGTSATTFAPLTILNRGQFVTVLYNMQGRPNVTYDPNKFIDVKQNDYFANPVMWAVNNDITSGTGNREFSPNEKITREQVAVMLYKYAKLLNYDTSVGSINLQQHFPDANKIDSWASDAMKWAVTNNIISGKATNSGTKLDPLGNTTRAECAQMIKNFVKKFGK